MLSTFFHQKQALFLPVFIALLVFQSAGWFLVWHMAAFDAQREARSVMAKRKVPVQTITISNADFLQVRLKGKEIRLDGRLYDIRAELHHADSVTLEVYHDVQEEALYKTLSDLFSTEQPSGKSNVPVCLWLAQWIGLIYIVPESPVLPVSPGHDFRAASFPSNLLVRQDIPDILAPPPKV